MAKKNGRSKDPSKARISYTSAEDPLFTRLLIGSVEYATGRKRLEKVYTKIKRLQIKGTEVWELILKELEVGMIYDERKLRDIAPSGPLIVIANHPFGVVDGLILGHLISQIKSRFFVLVHEVLCREPMLNPYLLPVYFQETKKALQGNIQTRKLAMERLEAGEVMGIFPSGGVATSPRLGKKAEDLEWKRFVVKLIQKKKATVLPMYIHGRNSHLFQLASKVSQNLRYGLLLNEVRNKMGKNILISIGDPIPYSDIEHLKNRQELLDHLRQITEALSFQIPENLDDLNVELR